MFLSFSSTGDDGFDPIRDYIGAPPEPSLAPRGNTLQTGKAALWGHVSPGEALDGPITVRVSILWRE